jgi:MHS family shikimate/dehydroshikimate transporter-like MFS transporter
MAGAPLGLVFATGAFAALGGLTSEQFLTWGWRIPFLAGVLGATTVGAALMVGAVVVSGGLSDRLGRRAVITAGAAFIVVFAVPLFLLVSTRSTLIIFVAVAVAWTGAAAMYGPIGTYMTEIFGANVRYTGASLGYQVGAVLGGGLAPTLAAGLYAAYGIVSVGAYVAVAAVISLLCVTLIRPSRADEQPADRAVSSHAGRP